MSVANARRIDDASLVNRQAEAGRAMLAALKQVHEASRHELNSPLRQEIMGKALPMVRAAIAQAEGAGITVPK